jgi:hypothetical protein
MSSEIKRLQMTVDLMQKELVQVRTQIDVPNARCTTMTQAAPEAREEPEHQKSKTCKAVKTGVRNVTRPAIRAQRAAGQEERAREAKAPHRISISEHLPVRGVDF